METKPKTNADRIRNMTDEELVDVIHCPLVEVEESEGEA